MLLKGWRFVIQPLQKMRQRLTTWLGLLWKAIPFRLGKTQKNINSPMYTYLDEVNCKHEGEWIPAEEDTNVRENIVCIHCGVNLLLPQEDEDC